MRSFSLKIIAELLFIAFIVNACGSLPNDTNNLGQSSDLPTPEIVTQESDEVDDKGESKPSEEEDNSLTRRISFDQLGISLEIPSELYVAKSPNVHYEDASQLESYLFYIQNYGFLGGPSSGNFQMYGFLQYSDYNLSWDEFENSHLNSPMNAYATYIEVGGLRGFDTQLSGERNRNVYHFYLEGLDLGIAVSEPTEENKARADEIVNSLELLPIGISRDSQLKLVSDLNGRFQILMPRDWEHSFLQANELNLTTLIGRSTNLEVNSRSGNGPDDNVSYENGILLTMQVNRDDSALSPPFPDLVQQEYHYFIDGMEAVQYFFTEPSTLEGEMRQLQVYNDGLSYLLRFAYAEDADLEMIEFIISSLNLSPEHFFTSQ